MSESRDVAIGLAVCAWYESADRHMDGNTLREIIAKVDASLGGRAPGVDSRDASAEPPSDNIIDPQAEADLYYESASYWRKRWAADKQRGARIIRGLLRNCSDWGDVDSISLAINDEEREILTAARDYIAHADATKGEK